MKSLRVGHYTNKELGTGLSVFLFDMPAIGAYHICGSSPATRELHILDTDSNVNEINGLVFTGGSAFGLGAIDGAMRFLQEQSLGRVMPHGGVVPIVPGAAIYDLAIQSSASPTMEDGYQACLDAVENNFSVGRIGAGTGASVGKVVPEASRMSGGLGVAKVELDNGLAVFAYVVVNAVGDIWNDGKIIAGAKTANGEFANCQHYLFSGSEEKYFSQHNTTLAAIFTNAKFSKAELKRISKMAVAGMANAIAPAFTRYDGDVVFSFSLGEHIASELTVGAIAAELVRKAIINAVKGSVVL
jgi:L-aminopeptidase/D-esterase-like protein